jgi:hypothetical protein
MSPSQAKTYEIVRPEDGAPSIRCLLCQRVSYNPNDVEQRYCNYCNYCNYCHIFHDGRSPGPTDRNIGQLGPHDQGELRCAISTERGFIIMRFGKAVSWLSIGPTEARSLARVLLQKADEIERRV